MTAPRLAAFRQAVERYIVAVAAMSPVNVDGIAALLTELKLSREELLGFTVQPNRPSVKGGPIVRRVAV